VGRLDTEAATDASAERRLAEDAMKRDAAQAAGESLLRIERETRLLGPGPRWFAIDEAEPESVSSAQLSGGSPPAPESAPQHENSCCQDSGPE